MFLWLKKIISYGKGGPVGDEGALVQPDTIRHLFDTLVDVESRLTEVEKKAEATRRKVYRDEAKGNGSDNPEVANTSPGRYPSPYLQGG